MLYQNKSQLFLSRFFSVAATTLGLMVLIGWYTENVILIQVSPNFVPMQYNTALGFLFSGSGLLLLSFGSRVMVLLTGTIASLIGFLTLLQYMLGINLGIDQLIMEHYITVETSHPGRMAPNTALCFFLIGILLVNAVTNIVALKIFNLNEMISLLVIGLAFMALLGYFQNIETAYGWGNLTRMAIHTSAGFLLLGFGSFLYCYRRSNTVASVPLWVPFLLYIVVLAIDVNTMLGIAAGIAYIPLVYCSIWFKNRYASIFFASLSTIMIIIGVYASPRSFELSDIYIINRFLSVMAVWFVALIILIQKKTQFALDEEEKRFKSAMDYSAIGMAIVSSEGKWLKANEALCEILDYSEQELQQIDFQKITHPDDLDTDLDYVHKMLSGEIKTYQMEKRYIKKNGEVVWVLLSVSLVRDHHGQPDYFISQIQDISVRKQATEDLLNSNRELERFAYIASHDLQEPLRMVASYTELLAARYKDKLDEEANEYIRFAVNGAKRMQKLINDLLAYSRVSNKKAEHSTINTDTLTDELIMMFDAQIDKDKVMLSKDRLPEIKGDLSQIIQLFQNIIGNAIKYSDPERKNRVHISATEEERHATFCVSDTGIGIAEEYFDQIFVIFKRLHSVSEYSGTGLGLAISKKIIETHGGKIWLESVVNKETKFFFKLPIDK